MAFKLVRLLILFKKVLPIFEYEWMPDTTKEEIHKQHLVKESWKLIDDFVQELHLNNIK